MNKCCVLPQALQHLASFTAVEFFLEKGCDSNLWRAFAKFAHSQTDSRS